MDNKVQILDDCIIWRGYKLEKLEYSKNDYKYYNDEYCSINMHYNTYSLTYSMMFRMPYLIDVVYLYSDKSYEDLSL